MSLPGVARAIQAIGPRKYAPNQIEVMREADRLRRKREAGERLTPQEIAAWAQLAQLVMTDESLVGGLVNLASRSSREAALKDRLEEASATAAAAEASADATPPVVPVQAGGVEEFVGPQTPQSVAVQPPAPPVAPQVAPAPAPAPTGPEAVMAKEREERAAEMKRFQEVAERRDLTVSDLYGLAATAKSPEQLRTVMAMVPGVIERDPAYAPKSLSELLFGTRGGTNKINKELMDIWGSARRATREESMLKQMQRGAGIKKTEAGTTDIISKTTDRETTRGPRLTKLEAQAEASAASAAQRKEAARLAKERADTVVARRPGQVSADEALAKAREASANLSDARRKAIEKKAAKALRRIGSSIPKGLPPGDQTILAQYATWADTEPEKRGDLPEGNPFKGKGAAAASQLANSILMGMSKKSSLYKTTSSTITSIGSKALKKGKPRASDPLAREKAAYQIAKKEWEQLNAQYLRQTEDERALEERLAKGKPTLKDKVDSAREEMMRLFKLAYPEGE